MPTEDCGGQGAPRHNSGTFVLEYHYVNRNGRRTDKKLTFTEYDKALAKYERIDDSAAIWDTTRLPELCVAKTRIAYYAAQVRDRKDKSESRTIAVKASEPEYASMMLTKQLKKTTWVLLPDTLTEIEEAAFNELQALNQPAP
jgi:hypothetical protein